MSNSELNRQYIKRGTVTQDDLAPFEYYLDEETNFQNISIPDPSLFSIRQRSQEWLDIRDELGYRFNYVSATEAAKVLKVKTGFTIFFDQRLRKIRPKTEKQNVYMQMGNLMEDFILSRYFPLVDDDDPNREYYTVNQHKEPKYRPGIMVTPNNNNSNIRLFCSPDMIYLDERSNHNLLEAKYWVKKRDLPLVYEEIPIEYIIQVFVQLIVSQANEGYLILLKKTENNQFEMISFRFILKRAPVMNISEPNHYDDKGQPLYLIKLFQKMMDLGYEKKNTPEFKNLFTEYQKTKAPTHKDFKEHLHFVYPIF